MLYFPIFSGASWWFRMFSGLGSILFFQFGLFIFCSRIATGVSRRLYWWLWSLSSFFRSTCSVSMTSLSLGICSLFISEDLWYNLCRCCWSFLFFIIEKRWSFEYFRHLLIYSTFKGVEEPNYLFFLSRTLLGGFSAIVFPWFCSDKILMIWTSENFVFFIVFQI